MDTKNQIVIYKSYVKALILILAGVLVSALFLTQVKEDGLYFKIITAVSSLSITGIGIYHLLDRRPQIIITTNGIKARSLNNMLISWQHIHNVYEHNEGTNHYIALITDNDVNPALYTKWHLGIFKNMTGSQNISLSLQFLKVNRHNLFTFISNMIVVLTKEERQAVITKHSNLFNPKQP